MRYLAALTILLFAIIAPNLIWLATSTVRIENSTGATLDSVSYRACEKTHRLGTFPPDEAELHFLEACGDDTLEIVLGKTGHCQIYVEGELYHVDATISSRSAVECEYDDLLSSLFINKLF